MKQWLKSKGDYLLSIIIESMQRWLHRVEIDCDYMWKYGEPSIYSSEMIYYLSTEVNGELIDDGYRELEILEALGLDYDECLKKVQSKGAIVRWAYSL